MADWLSLLGSAAGGGGGGGTYGNSGSSGVSTPVTTTAGGGIGTQSFDFANRAFAPQTNWLLWGAVALVGFLVLRKVLK